MKKTAEWFTFLTETLKERGVNSETNENFGNSSRGPLMDLIEITLFKAPKAAFLYQTETKYKDATFESITDHLLFRV